MHGDGSEQVVAFASRSLTRQERQYCVTRRELLAVVEFVQHFRHYLWGCQFTLLTDNSSIVWIQKFKEPEGQLARWLESTISKWCIAEPHSRKTPMPYLGSRVNSVELGSNLVCSGLFRPTLLRISRNCILQLDPFCKQLKVATTH